MDIELFRPLNLHIISQQESGYVVSWEMPAEGKNALDNNLADPFYQVFTVPATGGPATILVSMPAKLDRLEVFIPSGIGSVYVVAVEGGSTSTQSNTVTLVTTNSMPNASAISIGKDDSGIARSLSVTEDGVLRVTGATVNNYGGDASAANQTTTIGKLDNIFTAVTDVETATNAVEAGLSNVGLSASTIAALGVSAISNFPSNYPDVDTTTAVNTLNTNVAKEATLLQVRDNVAGGVKTSDLALSAGVLTTHIDNFPSDYPDSAVLAEVGAQTPILTSVDGHVTGIEALATSIDGVTSIISNTQIPSMLTKQDSTITELQAANTKLLTIQNSAAAIEPDVDSINTEVQSISLKTDFLLKTTDLELTSGVLSVHEVNAPVDYPDSTGHALLASIDQHIVDLTSGQYVIIDGSLPAGTNLIGRVDINTMPLPVGAATEATLQTVSATSASIRQELGVIEAVARNIYNGILSIDTKLGDDTQNVVLDEVVTFNNSINYRPEAVVSPEELVLFPKYTLQVFSYQTSMQISLYRETALDNNNYYHSLPSFSNVSLFQASVFEHEFTLMRNIMIKLAANTPSVKARIRITGIK